MLKRLGKAKQVLNRTLKKAFKDFKCSNNSVKLGYSTFCKMRPKHVVPRKLNRWCQNLCEYCENLQLKLMAVKQNISYNSKYEIVGRTLCKDRVGENSRDCIERRCGSCGVQGLQDEMDERLQHLTGKIEWKEWKQVKQPITGKAKKTLVIHESSPRIFITSLCKDVNGMSTHLYKADWQYKQYNYCRKNPEPGQLVIGMDFAENYRTSYQREVSSAHWSYGQITIHPMVCHYLCPEAGCNKVVKESIIAI